MGVYENANGALSYIEMRERLLAIRSRFDMDVDRKKDFWIACIRVDRPMAVLVLVLTRDASLRVTSFVMPEILRFPTHTPAQDDSVVVPLSIVRSAEGPSLAHPPTPSDDSA